MTAEGTAILQIQRAIVVSVMDGGQFGVLTDGSDVAINARFIVTCSCHSSPSLVAGDGVLIVDAGVGTAMILGAACASSDARYAGEIPTGDALPESLVLEATDELILRVGDGSVTIRKDGKILIKGKDLVSHAQRVNRIKGGSVAIN